jgi:hypothetical protein
MVSEPQIFYFFLDLQSLEYLLPNLVAFRGMSYVKADSLSTESEAHLFWFVGVEILKFFVPV